MSKVDDNTTIECNSPSEIETSHDCWGGVNQVAVDQGRCGRRDMGSLKALPHILRMDAVLEVGG